MRSLEKEVLFKDKQHKIDVHKNVCRIAHSACISVHKTVKTLKSKFTITANNILIDDIMIPFAVFSLLTMVR